MRRVIIWVKRSEPPSTRVVVVLLFKPPPPLTPLLLSKLNFSNFCSISFLNVDVVVGIEDDLKVVVLVIVMGLDKTVGFVSVVWAPPNVRVSYLLERKRKFICRQKKTATS
jgi:hypothetical protein